MAEISIEDRLYRQIQVWASELDISHSQLIQLALDQFVAPSQANRVEHGHPAVMRGDLFWVQGLDIPHPYVILQDNVFNRSRITSVVVCPLTSNLNRASIPGNVLLDAGEANLSRPSVVEVSKVTTLQKAQLGDYIGALSQQRVESILAGMRFQQRSFFER